MSLSRTLNLNVPWALVHRKISALGRSGANDLTTHDTAWPEKLGLVIDLDTCVGCHACVISCKEWNTAGYGSAIVDQDAYGAEPLGTFLNRIHTFEVDPTPSRCGGDPRGEAEHIHAQVVHFPKSCLHCEDAPCVTVCPTGASYKRADDGIVLVNEDRCIGCGLCAWGCPYGAREMDQVEGVMKKCTLCVDRIYNENIPEVDRVPSCVRTCPAGAPVILVTWVIQPATLARWWQNVAALI